MGPAAGHSAVLEQAACTLPGRLWGAGSQPRASSLPEGAECSASDSELSSCTDMNSNLPSHVEGSRESTTPGGHAWLSPHADVTACLWTGPHPASACGNNGPFALAVAFVFAPFNGSLGWGLHNAPKAEILEALVRMGGKQVCAFPAKTIPDHASVTLGLSPARPRSLGPASARIRVWMLWLVRGISEEWARPQGPCRSGPSEPRWEAWPTGLAPGLHLPGSE